MTRDEKQEVLTIDAKDQRVGLFEPPNAKLKISATGATAMTRDDIIRMAREAEFIALLSDEAVDGLGGVWADSEIDITDNLSRFAALVAAAEREACAKVCEEVGNRDADTHAWDAADAIRARGEFGKQLGVWNNGY